MIAPPIYNPVVPVVLPVPGGMVPGRMLRIQGSTPPQAKRFEINLQCGPTIEHQDDIAFHFNPRFEEKCVVRNHLAGTGWGPEDRGGGMPLAPGRAFEVLVLCEPNVIKVAVNGAHFCEFPHRLPFQGITHLTVKGDVTLTMIGCEGVQAPAPQQAYMPPPPPPGAPGYGPPGYAAPGGAPGYAAPGYGPR